MNERNILRHELIGLKIKIKYSSNKYLIGLLGKIIYETYNLIYIKNGNKIRKIPKKSCIFIFFLPDDKEVVVDGKLLVGRPEDRLKKRLKYW
ncbi:MAG TPA: ribonuclease P protein component 1 [Thermoproteales archaeon]|nr:ribonuclease P protein component 1 [Thermoproteales archaeon]